MGSRIESMLCGSGQREGLSTSTIAAVGHRDVVAHAGRGGDEVELVLALQPLLNNLHVQQTQKTAAEAEAEGDRAFRLEKKRRIVEPEFLKRIAEQRVLVRVHRIEAAEDHRLEVFKAGQRGSGGVGVVGNGIADLGIAHVLNGGGKKAHFAGGKLAHLHRFGRHKAHRLDLVDRAVGHEPDALALAHGALHHANQHDDTTIRVEPRVEDERLQRGVGIAGGWRQPVNNGFEHLIHALAGLGAHRDGIRGVQADGLLNGFLGAQDVGRRQVDLIDDRNNFKAVIDSQVGVGQRLRLHTLGCVHNQQRAFARGKRARNLVAEIHMARRVNEVELIDLAVPRLVQHAHGVGLDGNAALAFQVHRVQDLGLHLALGHRAGEFEQAVAQRRLAVVDVGDDCEVAKKACIHEG